MKLNLPTYENVFRGPLARRPVVTVFADEPWEPSYTALLKKYVSVAGVHYAAWKANKADFQALADITNQTSAHGPSSRARGAELAYYINAYNAWILREVLENYPINSIRDVAPLFGAFTQSRISVAGEKISLNHLEKQIIIEKFHEPRSHFAINCASRSCPPLRSEAFTAGRLDDQLAEGARAFLNNNSNGVKQIGSEFAISKIFEWYKQDFQPAGGPVGFINNFREQKIPKNAKITIQDYDWSLNDAK